MLFRAWKRKNEVPLPTVLTDLATGGIPLTRVGESVPSEPTTADLDHKAMLASSPTHEPEWLRIRS